MSSRKPIILIIGVGNEYRSDDALGLIASRRLRELTNEHINVLEESGEGTALMESWKRADAVILIDAVHSGSRPGTIHRIEANDAPIPKNFFHYSTHAFGVAEAIELARALNQLPPRLIVYGIEGKSFEAGMEVSLEVENAVKRVVELVLRDVSLNVLSTRP
jgi:hydrogenase maturation protease